MIRSQGNRKSLGQMVWDDDFPGHTLGLTVAQEAALHIALEQLQRDYPTFSEAWQERATDGFLMQQQLLGVGEALAGRFADATTCVCVAHSGTARFLFSAILPQAPLMKGKLGNAPQHVIEAPM